MMFLLSRVIWLTEEEYQAEVAARADKNTTATLQN